jgi:hypothetical protein
LFALGRARPSKSRVTALLPQGAKGPRIFAPYRTSTLMTNVSLGASLSQVNDSSRRSVAARRLRRRNGKDCADGPLPTLPPEDRPIEAPTPTPPAAKKAQSAKAKLVFCQLYLQRVVGRNGNLARVLVRRSSPSDRCDAAPWSTRSSIWRWPKAGPPAARRVPNSMGTSTHGVRRGGAGSGDIKSNNPSVN